MISIPVAGYALVVFMAIVVGAVGGWMVGYVKGWNACADAFFPPREADAQDVHPLADWPGKTDA